MKYIVDKSGWVVGQKPDDFELPEGSDLEIMSEAETRLLPKSWESVQSDLGPTRHDVTAQEFMLLFTPHEIEALWEADPRLKAGALLVLAQGGANLKNQTTQDLIGLAVARGVLAEDRAKMILAGQTP